MSEFKRPLDDELEPFEVQEYTVLMECWDVYVSERENLFTALRQAMDGTGGPTLHDAMSAVHLMKDYYMDSLVQLSEAIFDELEDDEYAGPGEAVILWSQLMDEDLKERAAAMRAVNSRAVFDPTPIEELRTRAKAYAEGRARLRREEGGSHDVSEDDAPQGMIGIERLEEIIADDEMEWENLSEVSEGDEYAEWVLDEFYENLEEQIDTLLELCPPGLYEQ